MAVDLADLFTAAPPAVVTMEIQRGVIGDLTSFPELTEVVEADEVIENTARLIRAARTKGVAVVHCTAGFRADRRGSPSNAPLIASLLRRPEHLLEGTEAVELVAQLEVSDDDLVSHRRHGVSPFTGTTLDATLRALGVSTVIATGVALNLGILGLAIEAVNLGYHVVVPRDAVAGVPPEYADAVISHTLRLVALISTVDEIVSAFK